MDGKPKREEAMRRRFVNPVRAVFHRLLFVAFVALLSPAPASAAASVAAQWNQALLDAVKATRANDVVTARALAIVHTAMFDAWAAYDDKALGTQSGSAWRRPAIRDAAA